MRPPRVVTLDPANSRCRRWLRMLRWLQLERAMRPLRVVVDEHTQDALQVTAVKDQQPVEALDADGSDEPLGDGVCLRRRHGRLHDADATAAEHLVERAGVLGVAVADQEARAVVCQVEAWDVGTGQALHGIDRLAEVPRPDRRWEPGQSRPEDVSDLLAMADDD
jgi:hypothetical protein